MARDELFAVSEEVERHLSVSSTGRKLFVHARVLKTIRRPGLRLIVIAAPPGSGKSVLLDQIEAEWVSEGRTVVRLAPSDVAKALPAAPLGHAVVVDDAHLIEPEVLRSHLFNAAKLESGGCQIFATRSLPTLEWISLQLSGQVALITGADLKLTEEETRRFLNECGPTRFGMAEASYLHQKTGGWILGLAGAVMAAQRSSAGANRDRHGLLPIDLVDDYLAVNLVEIVPTETWALLCRLAALDVLNSDFVGHVLGAENLPGFRRLRVEVGIVTPSGRDDESCEILRPIREYLRRHWRLPWDEESALLERASHWCVEHGLYGAAVEYLLRAKKPEPAAALLRRHAQRMLAQTGDNPGLLNWLDRIVSQGCELGTDLRLWRAWSLVHSLRLQEADDELSIVEQQLHLDDLQGQSFADRLRVSIAARRGQVDAVESLGEAWLARWSKSQPTHASGINLLLALAALHRSNERRYRRLLLLARQEAAQSHNDSASLWLLGIEALGELEAGRAQYAAEIVHRAQLMAMQIGGGETPVFGMLSTIAACVHLELDDVETVGTNLAVGYDGARVYGLIETHLATQEAMVGYSELMEGPDSAILNLHQHGIGGELYTNIGHLRGVRVLLRAKRYEAARRRFEGVADALKRPADDPLYREARMTEAWLEYAQADYDKARELLLPLLAHADAHGQRRRLCSLLLLRAACEAGLGDRKSSRRCLSRGIGIACSGGLVRTVLDLSWALRDALIIASEEEEVSPEAEKFLQMLRTRIGIQAPGSDTPPLSSEQLTRRELEVVSLLDTPLRGREIADRLELSETTLKWHLRNIYEKMEVKNRAGAVSFARRYGLI